MRQGAVARLSLVLLLWASVAGARTWWVNGGCTNTGDGTTFTCASSPGGAGPFQTFGEALNGWNSGGRGVNDVFILRGVHPATTNDTGLTNYNSNLGSPDGYGNYTPSAYYPEGLIWLSDGVLNPPLGGSCGPTAPWNCGHALNCTGGQCTVRSAQVGDCPTCGNERAFLGSGSLRSDWNCVANCGTANAIWSRPATDIATDVNDPVTLPGTYRGQSSATPAQGTDPSILYTIKPRGCRNNPALYCDTAADCSGNPCVTTGSISPTDPFPENKTALAYAGDDVSNPADGQWSYQCTCNGAHAGDICTPRKVCLTVASCAHPNDGTHGQTRCNTGTRNGASCSTDDTNATTGCPGGNAPPGVCVDDGASCAGGSDCPTNGTRGCGADTCNQCQIFVNPPMSDDPRTTILEASAFQVMTIDHPTANVTFQNLDMGFNRRYTIKAEDTGNPNHKGGLQFKNVHFLHSQQQGIIAHGLTDGTNGVIFDRCVWMYGGRGTSFSNIGTFFIRVFDSTGIKFLFPIMRYGGSAGQFRADGSHQGGGAHGELFSYGDKPWDQESYTHTGGNHVSLQLKQITGDGSTKGSGAEIRGGEMGWDTAGNISIDTVTESWIHGTDAVPIYLHDTQNSVTYNNFTPDLSSGRLFWSNAVLENFLIRNSGQLGSAFNLTNAASVNVEGTASNGSGAAEVGMTCHTGSVGSNFTACTCTGQGPPCDQAHVTGATCTGTCALNTSCCSTERNQGAQTDETANPLIVIQNGHFQNCGYACMQIVGNHNNAPASAACSGADANNCFIAPNQIGDPGGVTVRNVTCSGTAAQAEAGGQSRCLIVQNCSAFGGSCAFTNILADNMTNETFVTRSNAAGEALQNMVTAGTAINFTQQSRLASANSYRFGNPTMPNANATTQPSGGTLDTLANFHTAFASQEASLLATATANYAGEWHITQGSPALCTGTNASAGADIENDPRPQTRAGSSCFDAGADELLASCAPSRLAWAEPPNAVKAATDAPGCTATEWWH